MDNYPSLFAEPTVEEMILEEFKKKSQIRLSMLLNGLNKKFGYRGEAIDALNKLLKENSIKVSEVMLAYDVKIKNFVYDTVIIKVG